MIYKGIAFPIQELWKDIKGYEGCYQVSNYGRVKSLKRETPWVDSNGRHGVKRVKERFLKPKTDKDGYKEFVLSLQGVRKYVRAHRLVGIHFVAGYQEDLVIDHKDAVKDNNVYYNLQWITGTQNTVKHYAKDAGLGKSLSSLSYYDWKYIGYLYNEGIQYKAIVENLQLDVKSPDTLWDVFSGRRLSSVTGFKKGEFAKRLHPCTKLTPEDIVPIIKERLIDKVPLKILSEKYGIAGSMVSRFCNGTRQPLALELFKKRYDE